MRYLLLLLAVIPTCVLAATPTSIDITGPISIGASPPPPVGCTAMTGQLDFSQNCNLSYVGILHL